MSFSGVKGSVTIWSRQTKRLTQWMMRMFFAGTVAFSIPVAMLFEAQAFFYGTILGLIACIGTKLASGLWYGPARWVIGWAMVGRAEFAYLIAQMALAYELISPEVFVIVIWALLYATIMAPAGFIYALDKHIQRLWAEEAAEEQDAADAAAREADFEFAGGERGSEEGEGVKQRKSALGDMTPVLAPSVQFLEQYDKRGQLLLENPTSLRLRIVFRQKPKKSLENIFVSPKFSLVKLGAFRDQNSINTMYGLRCVERMAYEDLRQLRRDIFSKTGGGVGFPDILEVQYLPPVVAPLHHGLIKLTITATTDKESNAVMDSAVKVLSRSDYYILQMNFNANPEGTTIMTCIAWPLPQVNDGTVEGMQNARNSGTKRGSAQGSDTSSVLGAGRIATPVVQDIGVDKNKYYMDNAIVSEDVESNICSSFPLLKRNIKDMLVNSEEQRDVNVTSELLIFDVDPLRHAVSLPIPNRMYGPR